MGFVFIGKNVKYKKKDTRKRVFLFGAPSGIRTPDTLLKRQVLYLLSYWGGWLGLRDSNPLYRSQSPLPYHLATPLCGKKRSGIGIGSQSLIFCGVGKGTRTLDTRNHNPVL